MKPLYLLLLGVFVLFISLTSVSFAYTLDDLFDYSDQLYNTNGIYTNVKKGCKVILDYETQIRTIYNNNNINASSFVVIYTDHGYGMSSVSLNFSDSSDVSMSIANASSKVNWINYTTTWKKWISLSNNGTGTYSLTYNSSGTNINNGGSSYNNTYGLVTTSYTGPFYNYNLQNNFVPPQIYSFIPYTNESIHVTLSNNLSGECIRLPFSPAENYKRIGNIQGWEDLDGFKMYWAPVLYVSGDETYGEAVSSYIYTKQNGGLSDGHMTFMEINNGSVYVNVDTLYNRQVYVLSIDAHIGDDYFPIYLDGHDYDATFYSYFYTTDTSVPSNNTGISQQYYESLPPSLQNFLENNSTDFNDTQQNNINYFLNDMFTDVFSGDQFGGNLALEMGYSGDILDSNYYSNLIYDFYRKIINTIAAEDTTSSITFNIRSKTFVLNSSDFLVPSGPLKTFVTTFLIAGIVYLFYLQIHRIVLSIATLDLYTTIKSFDQKHSVFM